MASSENVSGLESLTTGEPSGTYCKRIRPVSAPPEGRSGCRLRTSILPDPRPPSKKKRAAPDCRSRSPCPAWSSSKSLRLGWLVRGGLGRGFHCRLRLPEIAVGLHPLIGYVAHARIEGKQLVRRRFHRFLD